MKSLSMTTHQKKLALITGASRGIGQAIMISLATADHVDYVVGTATSQSGVDKINDLLNSQQRLGCGKILDITDQVAVDSLITDITKEYGVSPLILVNNAGINCDNLSIRMKKTEWLSVINTNLNGTFHVTQACLKHMFKSRWGRIINIGSIVGSTGNPGQTNYAATKGAINAFSKSLAKEVATRGITVNVVAPGFIDTDMTMGLSEKHKEILINAIPMKRIGQPEEVSALVVFLASMATSYITGQVIHVNGGMYS